VRYYELQKKAEYEYYAEQLGIKYKDVLEKLSTSEDKMRAEAERMAIDDVLFELIKRTENITLEESDKTDYLDRYVEKYVNDYGYEEEYVRKNLLGEVYDSMLYDKVCEFLIMNNDFN
jgi:FKBP-type peptidyl-prolyl cis-trans isomerase (trigger factor)